MSLQVNLSWRCHTAQFEKRPTLSRLRQLILDESGIARGFSTLTSPAMPCIDDTWVKVIGNDRTLVVGVCLIDSIPWLTQHVDAGLAENVEVLFNPWNDGIGYVQFCFGIPPKLATVGDPHRDPDVAGDVQSFVHAPYPQAHSSAFTHLSLRRHAWAEQITTGYSISGRRLRWLFAWFDTNEVFARGPVCGFNVCRHRPPIDEFSSWNYCAGNGAQDAQSLGRLYRFEAPVELHDLKAAREGPQIVVAGRMSKPIKKLNFAVADADDHRTSVAAAVIGERFELTLPAPPAGGRVRLYPDSQTPVEPHYLAVDVPEPKRAARFTLSALLDSPMNIITHHYTPARLDAEMRAWKRVGVSRIHWIEYGDWSSFWREWDQTAPHYDKSRRACGDLLAAAAKAAHDHGLEFIGDLKTFDLGMNCFIVGKDRRTAALELDNKFSSAIPEIVANRPWTMQAHPDLVTEPAGPIRRLRFYSLEPIGNLKRAEVELFTSRDNKRYTKYRRPFAVAIKRVSRRHMRWTPTGAVPDNGTAANWMIELSGLDLRDPFAAVRIGRDVTLTQRGFMVVEAVGDDDAAQPVTMATNGAMAGGFFCWRGWQGWTNLTEALLSVRRWSGREFGVVFRQPRDMPTLLEPGYDGARQIWLERMRRILTGGADGVSIRTYCHHNGPMCYLQYAYAQPVLDAFRAQFGRDPQHTPRDYKAVREIRRDFYTQFMRQARKLTCDAGKKLMFELESGVEIGSEYDCRMQLPLDWERFIREGLIDEIRLKWWTAHASFVHERVMPLARKHDIPVSIISRCLHRGIGMRPTEMAQHTIGGAIAAGFDGYTLYEHQNLIDRNPTGRVVFKGPVEAYCAAARETIARLAESAHTVAKSGNFDESPRLSRLAMSHSGV